VTAASLCRTRVKICCIGSIAEAEMAVRHGASAIGLVSEMPSGPGVIDEALIAEIAARVPAGVATFLLTSRVDPGAIVEQHRRCRTSAIQICDQLQPGAYARLRDALPGIALVQVIHVRGEESVREALDAAPHVNALLLDSGNPSLAVKELGGTGRTHDWRSSRAIVESSPVAVYLAGGLNASNVGEAIRQVRPFGVDLCSGIRVDGKLSEEKLAAFCRAVAEA
jgi:phosphoribosylanthranilate isomerase